MWSGASSTQRKIRGAKLTYGIVLDEFAENREHVIGLVNSPRLKHILCSITDFPVLSNSSTEAFVSSV